MLLLHEIVMYTPIRFYELKVKALRWQEMVGRDKVFYYYWVVHKRYILKMHGISVVKQVREVNNQLLMICLSSMEYICNVHCKESRKLEIEMYDWWI